MRAAVREIAELCRLLRLPDHFAQQACEAQRDFPLFAPRPYVARMQPGESNDPLLQQVLPRAAETVDVAGFEKDPVGDLQAGVGPGVLQKYEGRVLLMVSGACAVHCRYCFRRHYPYQTAAPTMASWELALRRIADDPSLREVILSGGDPLTVPDDRLSALIEQIARVPHVRRLRVHTRLPVMIPQRVTDQLLRCLSETRLTSLMVVHINHANELDAAVAEALANLHAAGIPLLNQAVLLAGVNDSVEAQASLCERLVDLRVIPYYLHQLDRVAGAAHFEVPAARGRQIVTELRRLLPGYAVPRFVREECGAPGKEVLA